jgi:hypothetical protein
MEQWPWEANSHYTGQETSHIYGTQRNIHTFVRACHWTEPESIESSPHTQTFCDPF